MEEWTKHYESKMGRKSHQEKEIPVPSKKAMDYTSMWSRMAQKKHRYNRMDPRPDSSDDYLKEGTKIKQTREEELSLKKEPWKEFLVQRIRKRVFAPSLTDKDIFDILDRYRRVYLTQKREKAIVIDPDLPACYYWDTHQLAEWVISKHFPLTAQQVLVKSYIRGRDLITLDANNLIKMGLHDLHTIKLVTSAVRGLLGLPPPNGTRAISREVPLEKFLKLKSGNGPTVDSMTFEQFCENEGIDYLTAKHQMGPEGYESIPGCCSVLIKPHPHEDVKWIPVTRHPGVGQRISNFDFLPSESESEMSTEFSSSDGVDDVPTVEELATNVQLRNTLIPKLLNDIVESVFCASEVGADRQKAVTSQLELAYSNFSTTKPEERLKLVTIIAEQLVDDILRAREILEDIEKFQTKTKSCIPVEEMKNVQDAVAFYVESIMPLMVSATLKQIKIQSNNINSSSHLDSESKTGKTGNDIAKECKLWTNPSSFNQSNAKFH